MGISKYVKCKNFSTNELLFPVFLIKVMYTGPRRLIISDLTSLTAGQTV